MQVLIIGAAGMVGRKLSERLVRDKALNGKSIDKLVLVDVVAPAQPAGFAGKVESVAADLSAPGKAERPRSTKKSNASRPPSKRWMPRSSARWRSGPTAEDSNRP